MKEAIKGLVKTGLRLAGRWAKCEQYYNRFAMAYHLAQLFEKHKVDCVLDVGGHQGGFGRFLRTEVGYSGTIISFEPVSANFRALERASRGDSRWHLYQVAIGDQCGEFQINVMKSGLLNSFLSPKECEDPIFEAWNVVVRQESVECRTLDSLWPELSTTHGIKNMYLKIDTQGFDFRVLQGASSVLGIARAMQTEASVRPLYEGMTPFETVHEYLRSRGFQTTGMYPVARDSELRLMEFDLIMVRCPEVDPRLAGDRSPCAKTNCYPRG